MVRLAETNLLFPWGQSGRDTGPAGAGPGARRARATSFQAGGLQRGLCPTDAPFSGLEPLTPLCHEPGPTGRKTSRAPPWDPLRSFIDGDVPGSPPRPALTARVRVPGKRGPWGSAGVSTSEPRRLLWLLQSSLHQLQTAPKQPPGSTRQTPQYLKVGIGIKNSIFTLKPNRVTQNTQMPLKINHRSSVV